MENKLDMAVGRRMFRWAPEKKEKIEKETEENDGAAY